jgi:hypothetical protein
MTRIPAGLTSSLKAGGKNFILQTEFISGQGPNNPPDDSIISGRIKTTVAVGGQVVHKVEKAYAGIGNDEDAFINAEKAVKLQHLQVAKIAAAKPKEFLASVSELTISTEDRLALIPDISRVIKLDLANLGDIPEADRAVNPILDNMEMVRDLVVGISKNTRLGKLQKMVGSCEDNKFVLIGLDGKTFFLGLKDSPNLSSLLEELEKIKA